MSVSIWVGDRSWLLGRSDFVISFFSTVAARAEEGVWGRRFPTMMTDLYSGALPAEKVVRAQAELVEVKERLSRFGPEMMVWDAEDLPARPPWGDDIADTITNLADYFWTADGEPLLDVLEAAFGFAHARGIGVVMR